MADYCKISGGGIFDDATLVFSKDDFERPIQRTFDAPALSHQRQDPRRRETMRQDDAVDPLGGLAGHGAPRKVPWLGMPCSKYKS